MNKRAIYRIGVLLGATCFANWVFAEQNDLNIGRVFLTPDERLVLNKTRLEYYARAEDQPEDSITPAEEPERAETLAEQHQPAAPPLIVNGFVRRHGTSGTVWINGESSYDGDFAASNIDHLKTKIVGERIRVAPLNAEGSVYLKPGQVYEPNENTISDSYTVSDTPAIGAD